MQVCARRERNRGARPATHGLHGLQRAHSLCVSRTGRDEYGRPPRAFVSHSLCHLDTFVCVVLAIALCHGARDTSTNERWPNFYNVAVSRGASMSESSCERAISAGIQTMHTCDKACGAPGRRPLGGCDDSTAATTCPCHVSRTCPCSCS